MTDWKNAEILTPEDEEALRVIRGELQHRSDLFRDKVLAEFTAEELLDHVEADTAAMGVALQEMENVMKSMKKYIRRNN